MSARCFVSMNSFMSIDAHSVNTHRREFLRTLVGGSLLMPGLLAQMLAEENTDPLAPKHPHFPAKAKRVIFIF